jgi:arylsulfatase A-like enzyme
VVHSHLSEPKTYIFFISDHGEMLGDHYFFLKSCPYEASMRVPFLLSGPGITSQQQIDHPVGLQDILPTCCDLAGIDIPEHVTGSSLVPMLTGKQSEWRERLIEKLKDRPEGFSDGEQLHPNLPYSHAMPHAVTD